MNYATAEAEDNREKILKFIARKLQSKDPEQELSDQRSKEVYQMKQGGLLFPKESTRKKRKKHHKSIIDRDMKNQCFICGKTGYTERHHIYGSANRKYSEQYGLTVYLCPECHRTSEISAHRNKEVRITLQRIGQRTFEKKCGSRDKFTEIFGKNYLEDE